MLRIFKSKIDRLVDSEAMLKIRKQKLLDNKNEKNASIENKIKKLENQSFINQNNYTANIAEINRKLKKIKKLIKVEKDYTIGIGNENDNDD